MINSIPLLRNIAEDMNKLNNVDLKTAADSISAVWQGEAANAYLRHCEETRNEIRSAVNELNSTIGSIEQIKNALGL